MMLVERWRMLLADESGFTLPELLTVDGDPADRS